MMDFLYHNRWNIFNFIEAVVFYLFDFVVTIGRQYEKFRGQDH